MESDDHVCLCFSVSLGKIRSYMAREDPLVASLISECLGAGTGCGWCVPYLKHLHEQHRQSAGMPTIEGSAEDYKNGRARFKRTGERDGPGDRQVDRQGGDTSPGA